MKLSFRIPSVLLFWCLKFSGGCEQCHSCDICGKNYKQYPSLWRHKKYVCGKEPQFPCSVPACKYRAKYLYRLKHHLVNQHCVTSADLNKYLPPTNQCILIFSTEPVLFLRSWIFCRKNRDSYLWEMPQMLQTIRIPVATQKIWVWCKAPIPLHCVRMQIQGQAEVSSKNSSCNVSQLKQ